jgi:hypothetical protein
LWQKKSGFTIYTNFLLNTSILQFSSQIFSIIHQLSITISSSFFPLNRHICLISHQFHFLIPLLLIPRDTKKETIAKKFINAIRSNITSYDCRSPISFISSCHVIFIISLFKLWIKKRRLYRHHNWIEKGNIHIHVWETLSRWSIVHIQLDRSTGWKLSGSTLPLHSPLYIMFVIPILYFGEYFIIILAVPYGFHMNRST